MTATLEAMAREAGFRLSTGGELDFSRVDPEAIARLARFAALVRAQALEDAARECEVRALLLDRHPAMDSEAKGCAAAIRDMPAKP